MRTLVTILCVLVVLSAAGLADEISVNGLTYPNIQIVDAKEGKVFFKISGGRIQSKAFADITRISITRMDSFNDAEKLMFKQGGSSDAKKLRKKQETRKDKVAEITRLIADPKKEILRLQNEAKRNRKQAAEDTKTKEQVDKKIADSRKKAQADKAKAAKLEKEAAKLEREAKAIERAKKKGWQNQATQRRNRAKNLRNQAAEQDPTYVKGQARSKRAAAQSRIREAGIISRKKPKDWKKHVKAKQDQAKALSREADVLEAKAKRIAETNKKKKTDHAKLKTESGRIARDITTSLSIAAAMEQQAKDFPATAERLKKKRAELEIELADIEKKLNDLAVASTVVKVDQYSDAIRAYEVASAQKTSEHVKAIIDFRLLSALNKAQLVDRATAKWLQLADREKAAEAILACYPRDLPKKGDAKNAKAIKILISRVGGIKDGKYQAAVLELLGNLLQREGREDEFAEHIPKGAKGGPKLEILKAKGFLAKKDFANAEIVINNVLSKLERESLPAALMIRGKVVLARSEAVTDKKKKRELMLDAGVDFMKVYTHFNDSPLAGEALYLTAGIMAALPGRPNVGAAIKACETVARDYAGTPIGQEASVTLETLKKK
jgi:hypothetical protein